MVQNDMFIESRELFWAERAILQWNRADSEFWRKIMSRSSDLKYAIEGNKTFHSTYVPSAKSVVYRTEVEYRMHGIQQNSH